jgi:hypothetical protein
MSPKQFWQHFVAKPYKAMNECVPKEAIDHREATHTINDTRAVREIIAESGLFDSEFYRSTYGDRLSGTGDPLDHFLEAGLAQGYLPSRHFDPVLYRVLVPECGNDNPLLHHIRNLPTPFKSPPLLDVFPLIAEKLKKKRGLVERLKRRIMWHISPTEKTRVCGSSPKHVMRNRAYAQQIAEERTLSFNVAGKRYRLKIPPPRFFLDRLSRDVPFGCARLPQGFWDAVIHRERIERLLRKDKRAACLTSAERRALAVRIGQAFRPKNGVYVEAFMDEILDHIDDHAEHPDFFRSAGFRGYPTSDERPFRIDLGWAERRKRGKTYAQYFSPDDEVLEGTLWKRLLISGYLTELPSLCRSRHVILVASDHFEELGARWNLQRFSHVRIAPRLSQQRRWDLLEEVKAVVDEAAERPGPRPVVLTQCGASLAFWLINRLFARQPKAFYIDLGQALNGWFFDIEDIKVNKWACIYAWCIVTNGGFEPFYRNLLGEKFEDWVESLRTG